MARIEAPIQRTIPSPPKSWRGIEVTNGRVDHQVEFPREPGVEVLSHIRLFDMDGEFQMGAKLYREESGVLRGSKLMIDLYNQHAHVICDVEKGRPDKVIFTFSPENENETFGYEIEVPEMQLKGFVMDNSGKYLYLPIPTRVGDRERVKLSRNRYSDWPLYLHGSSYFLRISHLVANQPSCPNNPEDFLFFLIGRQPAAPHIWYNRQLNFSPLLTLMKRNEENLTPYKTNLFISQVLLDYAFTLWGEGVDMPNE